MTDSKETKHLKTLYCLLTDIDLNRNCTLFTEMQKEAALKEIAALEWAIEQLQGVMK